MEADPIGCAVVYDTPVNSSCHPFLAFTKNGNNKRRACFLHAYLSWKEIDGRTGCGTAYFLKLFTHPLCIYFGKLIPEQIFLMQGQRWSK